MYSSLLSFSMPVYPGAHNSHKPHRSLNLEAPDPAARKLRVVDPPAVAIERRDRLGGLIHEYSLAA